MGSANDVFQTLWRAITSGELAADSLLPPSLELAASFGVSLHDVDKTLQRLAELELVQVRGDGRAAVNPSNVRSIARPHGLRVVPTPPPESDAARIESHALSALPILALAERRITAAELAQLDRYVDDMPESQTLYEALGFCVDFWGLLARSTHNPLLEQRVMCWGTRLRALQIPADARCRVRVVRKSAYRGLVHALRQRTGAPRFWLNVVDPLLS